MALRVWLPLNGNINNQGLSKIIPSGTPTFLDNGKMGKCISIAQRVSFTGMPKMDNFTILFGLKVDSCSSDGADSLGFGSYATDDTKCADFRFEATISSRACSFHNNSPYAITQGSRILITEAQKGEGHHCGVSYDGANLYTYIDGILTYTDTGLGGYLNNYFHIGQTSQIAGGMNDLRIYDECLSQKQIKEISKGLVAHYKLDNPYIETTINLAPGINGATAVNTNTAPAGDTTLNGTPMITPSGGSNGYNSGVTDPTHGYHAHGVRENGQGMMIFPNLNSVISQKGRGLGISATVSTKDILAGEKYTISWWQKTDNLSLAAGGGIYYKKTSDGTTNFYDGSPTFGYNTKLNTGEFMSRTFTRVSDYVQHDGNQAIYVYGGNSNEGTMYVKDVQIVRGEHTLPYAVGTRNGQTYEQDCSGNGYIATKAGALTFNPDSARYSGSTTFNGKNINYLYRPKFDWLKPPFTFNCWCNQVSRTAEQSTSTTTLQFIESQGRDCGYAGFSLCLANGVPRLYLGTATSGTYYSINSDTALALNTGHMLTGTYDGTTAKLYVDGVLKASQNSTAEVLWNEATGFTIGKMAYSYTQTANYFPFNGSISDVKVYTTALSADDILTMYKNSGIIDNKGNVYAYEFKEE